MSLSPIIYIYGNNWSLDPGTNEWGLKEDDLFPGLVIVRLRGFLLGGQAVS